MRALAVATVLTLTLGASGCLPDLEIVKEDGSPQPLPEDHPDFERTVQVQYLGVSGFTIRLGHEVVMTAPLYSNPPLDVLLTDQPIPPDLERVRRFHFDAGRDPQPTQDVKGILVGHAHYDHLMDVPAVWRAHPGARVLGSRTTVNILAGYRGLSADDGTLLTDRLVDVSPLADTRQCADEDPRSDDAHLGCELPRRQAGEWVPLDARLRVRALCSAHPDQFLKKAHLWKGCMLNRRRSPPGRAADFPEGPTYAYLIDFLDPDGGVAFRVYYQDAPVQYPVGHVPQALLDERAVDLALLCVGNFDAVEKAEAIYTRLKPRYVVLSHWEDFFRPQSARLASAPSIDVDEFARRLAAVGATGPAAPRLPAPGARFHYSTEKVS